MEIKLNIAKKHLYILMAFVLAVVGLGLVIAFNTESPETFGHSGGEITVTINSEEKSLQEAIDTLSAGGGGVSSGSTVDELYIKNLYTPGSGLWSGELHDGTLDIIKEGMKGKKLRVSYQLRCVWESGVRLTVNVGSNSVTKEGEWDNDVDRGGCGHCSFGFKWTCDWGALQTFEIDIPNDATNVQVSSVGFGERGGRSETDGKVTNIQLIW